MMIQPVALIVENQRANGGLQVPESFQERNLSAISKLDVC